MQRPATSSTHFSSPVFKIWGWISLSKCVISPYCNYLTFFFLIFFLGFIYLDQLDANVVNRTNIYDWNLWFIYEINCCVMVWVKQMILIVPLICSPNWEFSGTETTHTRAKWGSRPLLQLCPLILMTLNDLNIRPHHQFGRMMSAKAPRLGPTGSSPRWWPGGNDDVQFNISVLFRGREGSEIECFQTWYCDLCLEIDAEVLLISCQLWFSGRMWRIRAAVRRHACSSDLLSAGLFVVRLHTNAGL